MAKLPARQPQKADQRAVVKEAFESLNGDVGTEVAGIVSRNGPVFTKERHTEPQPELTHDEQIEKRTLIKLLDQWVVPAQADTKPDAERDRNLFRRKLEAQPLSGLWRFFDVQIPGDIIDRIQQRYRDISP